MDSLTRIKNEFAGGPLKVIDAKIDVHPELGKGVVVDIEIEKFNLLGHFVCLDQDPLKVEYLLNRLKAAVLFFFLLVPMFAVAQVNWLINPMRVHHTIDNEGAPYVYYEAVFIENIEPGYHAYSKDNFEDTCLCIPTRFISGSPRLEITGLVEFGHQEDVLVLGVHQLQYQGAVKYTVFFTTSEDTAHLRLISQVCTDHKCIPINRDFKLPIK